MPTDHHLDPDEDALADLGYETEDVEYKKLGKSIFWFFGFVVFCGVAGAVIFGFFIGWDNLFHPNANTAPFVKRMPAAPNPLLQTNVTARTDIRELRREENALLQGQFSWVDKPKGVVRLPIANAIDMYMQRTAPGNGSQQTTITSGAPPAGAEPPEHKPDATGSPHG